MKGKRWDCGACWSKRGVKRDGDAEFDGRPRYRCTCCGYRFTQGHNGLADDPAPSRRFDPLPQPKESKDA